MRDEGSVLVLAGCSLSLLCADIVAMEYMYMFLE